MLQNADFISKIGFDTDENDSAKLWQTFAKKKSYFCYRDLIHAMRSARNLKLTLERGRAEEDADKGESDEQDFPMPPP